MWKTLAAVQTQLGQGGGKTVAMTLNPKAVSSDELYGCINPTTKELQDGIIAKIMRDFSKSDVPGYKWMVLDGDIDAEWIESMNTVMDDNKVLTLVSNERIPLTGSMRLLLEVSHFRNASPATASRGGVLFLNESDVGWRPMLDSWAAAKQAQRGAAADPRCYDVLQALCEQYVAPTLSFVRKQKLAYVTPVMDIAMVETLTKLLDGLLTLDDVPAGSERDTYEPIFQMAMIWAFGGALMADKVADHRKTFSEWWRGEWGKGSVKWPDEGLVFDYVCEPAPEGRGAKVMGHWRERIAAYTHLREASFASIVVPTMETTRLTYFLDTLMPMQVPVMLVGNAGCAKTTVLADKLRSLDDQMLSYTINFNSFTDSRSLQPVLEQPLEKKSGMTFGPPGQKRMVYLLDDFNMPTPDKYGTQSSSALMRQQIDYGGFYDMKKLAFKVIVQVQYLGAMNPTAGSFYVIDRLQRHFTTLACLFPELEVQTSIYGAILRGHLSQFLPEVSALADAVTNATLALHREVADSFLPTAIKYRAAPAASSPSPCDRLGLAPHPSTSCALGLRHGLHERLLSPAARPPAGSTTSSTCASSRLSSRGSASPPPSTTPRRPPSRGCGCTRCTASTPTALRTSPTTTASTRWRRASRATLLSPSSPTSCSRSLSSSPPSPSRPRRRRTSRSTRTTSSSASSRPSSESTTSRTRAWTWSSSSRRCSTSRASRASSTTRAATHCSSAWVARASRASRGSPRSSAVIRSSRSS